MTPFILRERRKLPPDSGPSPDHEFDESRQVWMHLPSGRPLVVAVRDRNAATPFGETTITETKEGHDESEIASHLGTPFGETTLTKTSEGRNETEMTFMTNFGETTYTASREGTDQRETPLVGYPSDESEHL